METHDPNVVESDHCLEQEVCVAVGCTLIQIHVMDWAEAQREDPGAECSIGLAKGPKEKTFEGSSGKASPQ